MGCFEGLSGLKAVFSLTEEVVTEPGQRLQEPGAPARTVWQKAVNEHCKAFKHNDLDFSPGANAYHMPKTSPASCLKLKPMRRTSKMGEIDDSAGQEKAENANNSTCYY